ncbi:hypothetical protein TSUD_84130 [Trifolium subterraneum]|uniref:Protein kinase domain-containing protein n=1 Tax=Trifolium subterraneum TaxID=3900 RepID=A0A2Z6M0H6_TRISU|nr:hypothetical protein TSUD_84130 [Trifolium subterraneum]
MATTISITCFIFIPIIILSSLCPITTLCATVLEDLKNLHKPQDFNTTIFNNCIKNPSLRYCNSSPMIDLDEIFKHTIVASHLCNESSNPNCVESFPKIDLRNRPNIASLYLPDFLPRILYSRRFTFTPAILKAATYGFSKENLVGKSDIVHIYKGVLRDGTKVKIEMYWDDISRDSYHKFVEECKILSELNHKNLVKVLGWCKGRKFRAIITEWTKDENVEMWLSREAPSWNHRVKVLMGVVECMLYLHDEWPEVDYDLKTSSVLLSDNLEPLISRFQVGDRNNSRKSKNLYNFNS